MTELILSLLRCAASLETLERRDEELEKKDLGVVEKDLEKGKLSSNLGARPRSDLALEVLLATKEK